MNTVAIELMTMHSDPQYVSSSGSQSAILVDSSAAAKCGDDSSALWALKGEQVTVAMLKDVEQRSRKNGACNYEYHTGVLEVPNGKAVIQKLYLNICTRNTITRNAWVVNAASLKTFYERRASEYSRLALACAEG